MKKILLIGATGVLGKAFTEYLSQKNHLFIADNKLSSLKELTNKFKVPYKYCDVTKKGSIRKLVIDAVNELDGIDVVIHNIAQTSELILKKTKKFPDFSSIKIDTWNKDFEVNLTSVFLLAQEMNDIWKKNKELKSFIAISSLYGVVTPNPKLYTGEKFYTLPSYSSSKSGLISLIKWLSVYWANRNIATNSISPGGIKNKQSKKFINKYSSLNPVSRMGQERDIIHALDFLVNNDSNYLTGQNITIDGGYSIW
jgi:NAD(P)-dependent dehydrogenase (short-subunit alcohol dehydrogenase family)